MLPHAVVANNYGNFQTLLQLRAKDLFVESEMHSTIDCLQYFSKAEQNCITEAGSQSRPNGISSISVNNISGLESLLTASKLIIKDTYPDCSKNRNKNSSMLNRFSLFFISQTTSWSRLRISPEMFDRLIQFYAVFEDFLPYVLMFGKRIRDYPETSITSHMRLHADKSSLSGYEICYNIRHFELHGRELKDPWSCRHAAFYQRYSFAEHLSTWIVIQGPSKLKFYIEKIVSEQTQLLLASYEHPLYLHVCFFKMLERNWTSYLITLEEQRRKTSDKFAFLGSCKISVELQDVHDVHNIQAKMRTAISIIEGTMSVISTVMDLCILVQDYTNQACRSPLSPTLLGLVTAELKQLLSKFQNHMCTTSKFLQSSEDNKVMLLAIINHRHNDVIQKHTSSLDALLAAASSDSRLRTKIASKALAESSIMRIATLITVFYLPFNFTTAFFSTNLITFQGNGTLGLRKSVWVFIIMTGVLLGGTAMAVWIWKRIEKIGRRKNTVP